MFLITGPGFLPAPKVLPAPVCTKSPTSSDLSKKLDDYALLKKLGQGSFGDVWLAETTLPGDERALVAVKAIPKSGLDRPDSRIVDELEITKLFTEFDPDLGFFPQLVESFTDDNNCYIVQEFIPGGTLRDEMKRSGGCLSFQRAQFVMAQLIVILLRMHDLGVTHRDIKPENILVDAVGNVVLADLGLACRLHTMRQLPEGFFFDGSARTTHRECGTPGYMAPEVCLGHDYSYSVDVYSLGVVFFEMVFGELPFPQIEFDEMVWAQVEHRFSRHLEDLPKEMGDLMFAMMWKAPDNRISLLDTMSHGFFTGINWRLIADREYALPVEWAPPLPSVERSIILDKSVLVDKNKPPLPSGRHDLGPVELGFVTSRRSPTAKRPSLPQETAELPYFHRMFVSVLRFSGMFRGPVPSQPLEPYPALPTYLKSVRIKANNRGRRMVRSPEEGEIRSLMGQTEMIDEDIEGGEIVEELRVRPARVTPRRPSGLVIPIGCAAPLECISISKYSVFNVSIHSLDGIESFVGQIELPDEHGIEDGEVVEETSVRKMPVRISQIPVAARTPVINIPRHRPPALMIPTTCAPSSAPPSGHASACSALDVSIGQLDEILLSPPKGVSPRQTLAFQEPSPPNFMLLPEQNHPAPPANSGLDDTPPITPGPFTPLSGDCIAQSWKPEMNNASA